MHEPRLDRRLFLRATAATGAALTVGGLSRPARGRRTRRIPRLHLRPHPAARRRS